MIDWQLHPESELKYATALRIDLPPMDDRDTLTRELRLRLGPMQSHWEARGPGLMKQLTRTLPWTRVSKSVRVHAVRPRQGGGGIVLPDGTILFELVLANGEPRLPEVLRLAWLIAQAVVQQDCTPAQTPILAERLIPPILLAGEYVELAVADADTCELARSNWLDRSPDQAPRSTQSWEQQLAAAQKEHADLKAWLPPSSKTE